LCRFSTLDVGDVRAGYPINPLKRDMASWDGLGWAINLQTGNLQAIQDDRSGGLPAAFLRVLGDVHHTLTSAGWLNGIQATALPLID
jgi:hypothetical protein